MAYLIDADVLITAERHHYPSSVFPLFWRKLGELLNDGTLVLLDKVYDEICGNEYLGSTEARWLSQFQARTVKAQTVAAEYQYVLNTVLAKRAYSEAARNAFLDYKKADAHLIAYAVYLKKSSGTSAVVTYEVASNAYKSVKIPDACHFCDVRSLNIVQLLKDLNVTVG